MCYFNRVFFGVCCFVIELLSELVVQLPKHIYANRLSQDSNNFPFRYMVLSIGQLGSCFLSRQIGISLRSDVGAKQKHKVKLPVRIEIFKKYRQPNSGFSTHPLPPEASLRSV